ncbi:MAG: DUF6266 family protein [Bacteroidales bacterium]|nr:DUF6266 family protein [Bacteroidales bacterium]
MGRIKKGILGGISGKVGTVVGANWKTTSYIRSLPQNVKNPRTLGQRRQRSKFALVVALLRQLNVILRIGWKLFAKSQSPFNACTAYTLANAVKGTFPNFEIDYSKVLISCGSLAGATNGTASVANGDLVLSWDNNSGINSAEPTDTTLVAVINTAKSETIAQTTGVERSKETQTIKIPANWLGDDVEVYLGFVSEDGKEVANSVHIGKV